jgi:copper chaperone
MKKKISIEGMSCTDCVNHVKEALKEIGAENIEVNLDNKIATARLNDEVDDKKIKFAIEDVGYDVVKIENI